MPNEWKQARLQIKAYKNYYNNLSETAKALAAKSYVITAGEIRTLLNQGGDGTELGGLRIYIGLDNTGGQPFPVLHVIAEESNINSFDDYRVPVSGVDLENDTETTVNAVMPRKGVTFPCPTHCSATNVLNS